MTTYTSEDVAALVKAAEAAINHAGPFVPWGDLGEALAPFQPDPKEELIEEMAEAYWGSDFHIFAEDHQQEVLIGMTKALAVVTKHCLPH